MSVTVSINRRWRTLRQRSGSWCVYFSVVFIKSDGNTHLLFTEPLMAFIWYFAVFYLISLSFISCCYWQWLDLFDFHLWLYWLSHEVLEVSVFLKVSVYLWLISWLLFLELASDILLLIFLFDLVSIFWARLRYYLYRYRSRSALKLPLNSLPMSFVTKRHWLREIKIVCVFYV